MFSQKLRVFIFFIEKERIVIELQPQIGNKWATIATHLVGRTNNDVKNFWSSRQQIRMARILHSQSPSRKSHKASASTSTSTSVARPHFHEDPKKTSTEGEISSKANALTSSPHISAIQEVCKWYHIWVQK